jgi:hypothetical protein
MGRIVIGETAGTVITDVNVGYDTTLMMSNWTDENWYWWAYQIKRLGLQGKIMSALDEWDDDNSTGMVEQRAKI